MLVFVCFVCVLHCIDKQEIQTPIYTFQVMMYSITIFSIGYYTSFPNFQPIFINLII